MRKLMRSVARHQMELEGLTQINRNFAGMWKDTLKRALGTERRRHRLGAAR